jgi:hypothetical protein
VAGAGFEYMLTNSLALTTGVQAMRNRLTTYRLSAGSIPSGNSFWTTSTRFTFGFKYNRVRYLSSLAQQTK